MLCIATTRALIRPFAIVALLCVPVVASAAWPSDPYAGNVPLCTATADQQNPQILPDGAGGCIVTWQDYRLPPGSDIYAQRVNAAGTVQWTTNGAAVSTATGAQTSPMLVSDGAGGAIIVWYDQRSGTWDIYAQRVNAAGVPQWTANGVAVCTATGDQSNPTLVSDGAGGAVIAWYDSRSGSGNDIYAQRLNAAGTPQWPLNGVAICTATGEQTYPVVASDGSGGAIVTWLDLRAVATNTDLYAQRVNASGAVQWTANGVAVCTATGHQYVTAIASDGAGGAVMAWYDYRSGTSSDIYTQRVGPNGAALWAANGVAVCVASGYQVSPSLVPDGAGGAFIAWTDPRNVITSGSDIYAQRVNTAGTMQWTTDGVAVCTASLDQVNTALVADGLGGVIVTWNDGRIGLSNDIYSQRLSGAGVAQWTANGALVCSATGNQQVPMIATDAAGGGIITWYDYRAGSTADIYAQHIDRFGYLGAEPSITAVRDLVNDQGGRVKLSWSASWLDLASDPNLSAYDVYRSAPSTAPAGVAARARSGAPIVTSFADPASRVAHAIVLEQRGTQAFAWEYLATVSATHFLSLYSYLAATTADSIGGSNPYTPFMVVARNASGSMFWQSAADSGYSVDNLPPSAVSPFSGQYAGGAATLHWGKAGDADFASYRLYRGASSSFVPSPANLVVDQPDTGYVDVVGSLNYYKIASVDAHGNVGPYATVLPTGLVGIEPSHTPAALALAAQTQPGGAVQVRWALPQFGDARLSIHAVTGRLVRELAHGAYPSGDYLTRWDGRDTNGAASAAGIYLVRLTAGGRALDARVLRLP